jgi:hypothetical protein
LQDVTEGFGKRNGKVGGNLTDLTLGWKWLKSLLVEWLNGYYITEKAIRLS